jgi:hypothetical protein
VRLMAHATTRMSGAGTGIHATSIAHPPLRRRSAKVTRGQRPKENDQ